MIVGNHSAGKSSFINWYIGERVVKTGVAIETRVFIMCTSGRCVGSARQYLQLWQHTLTLTDGVQCAGHLRK